MYLARLVGNLAMRGRPRAGLAMHREPPMPHSGAPGERLEEQAAGRATRGQPLAALVLVREGPALRQEARGQLAAPAADHLAVGEWWVADC